MEPTHRDRVGPTLSRVASFVTGRRSRWVVLGVWLLLFAAMLPLSAKLPEVTEENYGRPDGSQSKEVGDLLAEAFPGGDTSPALLVYRREGGLTDADRRVVEEDAREVAELPLVGDPIPPFENANQISQDRSVEYTVVPIEQGTVSETNTTMEDLRELAGGESGVDAHLTGTVPLLNDLTNIIKEADVALLLATGLLVLVLLLLIYRSPLLAFVPLIVVFISYTIASGLLYACVQIGLPVSSNATSLLLVLMFGVGTDYCLLLVNRYRSALHGYESATDALAFSLPRVAPAIIASGLTVIAALLALLASSLELNQAFAPANAIGVAIVLVASLTLLPAVLSLLGRRAFWPVAGRVAYTGKVDPEEGGIWSRIGRRVLERPAAALAAAVVVLGIFSLGLLVYETEADVLDQFRAETDGTRGADALRAGFPAGALGPVTLLLERRDGRVTFADVRAVGDRAVAVDGVAFVSNIQSRSEDGSRATLSLILEGEPYDNEALARVEAIRNAVEDPAPGLRVITGGGPADRLDFREAAERDFKVVAPIALLVILLTLIILLRAIVAPLYLLATVLLSFSATFGLSLLFFKHVLDKPSVDPELPLVSFIFLVALGSDYNIFLMHRVREEAERTTTRDAALRALGATGSVITSAGIVLAGTFAVLMVVPFYFLLELGFIVALGILLDTFLVRTIVVPALVALVGERSWWPFRPPRAETSAAA